MQSKKARRRVEGGGAGDGCTNQDGHSSVCPNSTFLSQVYALIGTYINLRLASVLPIASILLISERKTFRF